MNLAYIAKKYDTVGGTERDLYELTRRLVSRGHDVHVYAYDGRIEPPEGLTLHRVPVPGIGRTARLKGLARHGTHMARSGGHDLVISYARVPDQDIVRCGGGLHRVFLSRMGEVESAAQRMRRKLDPYHRSMLAIERAKFRPGQYVEVQAISQTVKREVMKGYGVPEEDVRVVYDGIDTDRFHPDNRVRDRNRVRADFSIPEDAPVVLFLGNAFKRKGLDTLLAGAAATKNPRLHVLVVGADARSEIYKQKARQLGLAGNTHFAGGQSMPEAFYAAADVFALPSVQEAFGNVVLEAMACGVPAIVSGNAGAAEVLTGESAEYILNDPFDHEALADLIGRALAPGIHSRLAGDARRTAEQYSLEVHTQNVEQHYEHVLEKIRKPGGPR